MSNRSEKWHAIMFPTRRILIQLYMCVAASALETPRGSFDVVIISGEEDEALVQFITGATPYYCLCSVRVLFVARQSQYSDCPLPTQCRAVHLHAVRFFIVGAPPYASKVKWVTGSMSCQLLQLHPSDILFSMIYVN